MMLLRDTNYMFMVTVIVLFLCRVFQAKEALSERQEFRASLDHVAHPEQMVKLDQWVLL